MTSALAPVGVRRPTSGCLMCHIGSMTHNHWDLSPSIAVAGKVGGAVQEIVTNQRTLATGKAPEGTR